MTTIPKFKRKIIHIDENSLRILQEYNSYSGDDAEKLDQLADSYMNAVEEEVRINNPATNLSVLSWIKEQIHNITT